MSSVPAGPRAAATGAAAPDPVSVAFCPCPPLLPPVVAGRAAADTTALRRACAAALGALLSTRPELVVVVGAGPGGPVGPGDGGDLRGFGVDVTIPFAGPVRPGGRRTSLAHTLGAWLLDEAGHAGPRLGIAPDRVADVLAGTRVAVGVLAMGDGSARRSLRAPGHLDPAAASFDAGVAAAFSAGDAAALAALDPAEGELLLAAGVPTWRAVGAALAERVIAARLHHHEAPFGVGYLVADWLCA